MLEPVNESQLWPEECGQELNDCRESEALYRIILSNISDAVFITDDRGALTFICPNVDVIFKYSFAEVEAMGHISQLLGENRFTLAELEVAGEISNIEWEVVDKLGQPHWLLVNVKRVAIGDGTILYTCRDTTELRQARAQQRQSERRFQALIENGLDLISLLDADGRALYDSPAIKPMLGYEQDELIGRSAFAFIHPDDLPQAVAVIREAVQHPGRPYSIQFRFRHRDGSWRVLESVGRSMLDDPDVRAIIVNSRDITQSKAAEIELHRRINEQSALYQASQLFLDLVDIETTLANGCRLAVDHYGLKMAWVGLVIKDSHKVWPVAAYGSEEGYLHAINVTYDESQTGQGPTGTAIRIGQAVPMNLIETDPAFAPWRTAALARGYRSSAALPLRYDNEILGALNVYSTEPEHFTPERLQSLQSFANLVAVALQKARLYEKIEQYMAELQQRVAERTTELLAVNQQLQAQQAQLEAQNEALLIIQEDLLLSEAKLKAVFNSSPQAIILIDRDYTVQAFNKVAVGHAKQVLHREMQVGDSIYEYINPSDLEGFNLRFAQALRGQATRLEKAIQGVDGAQYWFEFTYDPVWASDGTITGVCFTTVAITARKQMEEAIRKNEEKLRVLFEILPVGVSVLDEHRNIIDLNSALEKILRISRRGLLERQYKARTYLRADGTPMLPSEFPSIRALKENRVIENVEVGIIIEDGETFWTSVTAAPLPLPGFGAVVVTTDITERKQAEKELRLFKAIIETSQEAIAISDPGGRLVYINPAHEKLFGYSLDEAKKLNYRDYYPPEAVAYLNQVVAPALAHGKGWEGELDVFDATGRRFPLWERADSIIDETGQVLYAFGLMHDVTERKETEEALRQRNRELALLHHVGQAFSSTLDLDEVLNIVLGEVRQLLDVVASSIWLFDEETGELVCRQVTDPQREVIQGWRLKPGEGVVGWVVEHQESVIVGDTEFEPRHYKEIDRKTGLVLRSILAVPLQVKKKVIGALQAVDTEIDRFRPSDLALVTSLAATAAIAIENARLYEQTRQDAETKASLLNEVNHRVKNNLAAIIGMLYAERQQLKKGSERTYEALMKDLTTRIEGLAAVHQLLSMSAWAPLSLDKLAGQIIRSALQGLPADKRIWTDITPSAVRVTPKQANSLAMVINELATNSLKYALLKNRQVVQVKVSITLDEDGMVLLEYRDDGPGFPDSVLRLERQNVGMHLIHNISRRDLRGDVALRNDQGAVVTLRFPNLIVE